MSHDQDLYGQGSLGQMSQDQSSAYQSSAPQGAQLLEQLSQGTVSVDSMTVEPLSTDVAPGQGAHIREPLAAPNYEPPASQVVSASAPELPSAFAPAPQGAYAPPAGAAQPAYGTTAVGVQPPPPVQYVYVSPADTGTRCWALGFIGCIPIPFIGMLAGALAMWFGSKSALRSESRVARENGRVASNWAATIVLSQVVFVLSIALVAIMGRLDIEGPVAGLIGGVALTVAMVSLYGVGLLHLIASIGGTVAASKGNAFRFIPAIPFLKPESERGGESAI